MIKRILLPELFRIIVVFCCIYTSTASSSLAHNITLESTRDTYDVGSKLAYLEDSTATLTLSDIIQFKKTSTTFKQAQGKTLSFTNTNSAYWFHFTATNDTANQTTWHARINYPLLDDIQFHVLRNGLLSSVNTGDARPFDSRVVNHQYYLFPISFAPHEKADIYIRVVSSGAITVPLQLFQTEELIRQSNTHSLLQGLHYGTLLILCIYNGLLFFSTKSRSYIYNALYLASLSLFMFSVSGLSFQYLWPNSPQIANLAIPVSEGVVVLAMALFARSFLYTDNTQIKTFHAINIVTTLGIAIVIIGLTIPYYLAIKLGTLLGIICISVIYIIGIARMAEGYKPAKLFVVAWSIFLAGAMTYALAAFGFISGQFIQEYIIRIATGAQVIFINVALAARVRFLNAQLIASEAQAKLHLESQVAERTSQLQQAMKKLSSLNNTLRELSTTDELTGIANRRFFNKTIDELIKIAKREQAPISLLLIDIDRFKAINDKYGHLAGDECLKHITEVIKSCLKRPGDLFARFGGEEFAVVLPNTNEDGAQSIAHKILVSISNRHIAVSGATLSLTVSIGISSKIPLTLSRTCLIEEADNALYQAKSRGRNTSVLYNQPVTTD